MIFLLRVFTRKDALLFVVSVLPEGTLIIIVFLFKNLMAGWTGNTC